ncbi:hypothetical protein OSTOST_08016 [Ostertagia ostertagi]
MLQPLYWNKKILVAWVSGRGPQFISKLSDEEPSRRTHTSFTGGVRGPNNTSTREDIQAQLDYGSVSVEAAIRTLQPDSVKYVPDAFVRMAEPIIIEDKPVVCFAGEHTHPTMYQTTIGAYESGEREAFRIIDHLSLNIG